jgi:hypothetical protein
VSSIRGGFFAFVLCAGLGLLTKISFLPLAAFATLALVVRRRRSARQDALTTLQSLRLANRPTLILATLALCASGLATWLYVENYVRFGRLRVSAVQALPLELALENRIVRRSWVIAEFRAGALDYEQALQEIARIPNRGNRNRARNIVERLRRSGGAPPPLATAPRYAKYWVKTMRDRLFGFHGNGSFVVPPFWPLRLLLLPAGALCLVAFAFGARRDELRDLSAARAGHRVRVRDGGALGNRLGGFPQVRNS